MAQHILRMDTSERGCSSFKGRVLRGTLRVVNHHWPLLLLLLSSFIACMLVSAAAVLYLKRVSTREPRPPLIPAAARATRGAAALMMWRGRDAVVVKEQRRNASCDVLAIMLALVVCLVVCWMVKSWFRNAQARSAFALPTPNPP